MNQVICGDSLTVLNSMSDNSINCCITSPPYYKQRDYKSPYQIGQEDTPETYVLKLLEILQQVHRILNQDGTLWLNLGDKYLNNSLLGLPWLVALKAKDCGLLLRSEIIWNKPNAMPSSVKNRPSTSHEHLFLFSKSANYFYSADSIREPHVTFSTESKMKGGRNHFGKNSSTPELGKNAGNKNLHDGRWNDAFHPLGRNKRTVWNIPTGKYKGSHFAVFPEKLVETCMLAGSKEDDLILDPFCGSGTVGLVAKRLNRKFIGVDCNFDYCKLAKDRIS